MSWPTALLVGLLCLLYLRSPIDLLPDRIGAVGLFDDLVVLLLSGRAHHGPAVTLTSNLGARPCRTLAPT